ncbi:hypothetical protein BMS_1361 [Halobacteriovorax marinus SJ]|uniref:Uncharacterized protein n=1 Tax=Halobacteriovorax marinus (strain ATCC BAA-682 / DSM 15412 / SJ) TaxID=862908 RepID=E1WZP3_HALMS|nr:hypothetical protein [Halobacteriovorax marinus]CBW26229.1 hypothetical protein BMS_1361 [Halobacteriovorax marinus SJ]
MLKLLLIESDERVLSLLGNALSTDFDAKILSTFMAFDAKELIAHERPDLIIVRNQYKVDDEKVEMANIIMNHLYDIHSKIPVVVLGDFEFPSGNFEVLPDRFRIEELKRLIIKLLKITPEQLRQLKLPDYVPLAIQNFYLMESTSCDIYIKLETKTQEKFIKRINKGDTIDKAAVQKYEDNNVQNFYIKKDDHNQLLNQLLQQSLEKIVKSAKSGKGVHEINSDTYSISQNLIDAVGVTEHTVRLSNLAIAVMAKSIEGHSEVSSLIKDILENKGSYAYKRNYLICAVCREIAPLMEWGVGDQLNLQLEKLTFVSFFHDIYLKSESHLKVFSNDEVKNLDLEAGDLVLNHANMASNLVQSFPKTPVGADILIKQHHGTTTGVGFVENYSASISPMAIAFIVVEKYVSYILNYSSNDLEDLINRKAIFHSLYEEFKLPSYKKIVDILNKLSIT